MPDQWTVDDILNLTKGYQDSCVLVAAAELNVFDILAQTPLNSSGVAGKVKADVRGMTTLLDALVSLRLLNKQDGQYSLDDGASEYLTSNSPRTMLSMVQHHGNCLRRWSGLAAAVRDGKPVERRASIRGEEADVAAFIGAMHNICNPVADQVVADLLPLDFTHLLDVGGASGTWTIAFLRTNPHATATLFDREQVIPLAQKRLAEEGLSDRVETVGGDFMVDPLPEGADLAWISAIAHQNSREQNRQLFSSVAKALRTGGRVLIRDIVMDESRTSPQAGALFAINMLVATEGGGTFTLDELREDLEASGLSDVALLRNDEGMNSVVSARKR